MKGELLYYEFSLQSTRGLLHLVYKFCCVLFSRWGNLQEPKQSKVLLCFLEQRARTGVLSRVGIRQCQMGAR